MSRRASEQTVTLAEACGHWLPGLVVDIAGRLFEVTSVSSDGRSVAVVPLRRRTRLRQLWWRVRR